MYVTTLQQQSEAARLRGVQERLDHCLQALREIYTQTTRRDLEDVEKVLFAYFRAGGLSSWVLR